MKERKSHRHEPPTPTPTPTPTPIPHQHHHSHHRKTITEVYPNETAVYDSFVHWKQKHGKYFGKDEEDKKFQVYKQNFFFVHKHNMKHEETGL